MRLSNILCVAVMTVASLTFVMCTYSDYSSYYYPYYDQNTGGSSGGLLALIGFLFLMFILFGLDTRSRINIVNQSGFSTRK